MKQCIGSFKSELKKRLEEGQPMNDIIDDIEFTSLDTLKCAHGGTKNKTNHCTVSFGTDARKEIFVGRRGRRGGSV